MGSDEPFKNISYSLSENILSTSEVQRLEKVTLILYVSRFLRAPDIKNDLRNGLKCNKIDFLKQGVFDVLGNIVPKIYLRVKSFDSRIEQLNLLNSFIKSTIYFLVLEVCKFIKTSDISSAELNMFIDNLVITNQGTVNTEKTIKKLILSNRLSTRFKFSYAIYYFLGYDIVKQYYSVLSERDKGIIFQKLREQNDFCLYFWMWRIIGTREKLIQACFLREDGTFVIYESDDKNHIAIKNFFQNTIMYHKEMGVQYLWVNYISYMKEKEQFLKDSLVKYMLKPTHFNIIMFLIIEVNKKKLTPVFYQFGYNILNTIVASEPRWLNVFFKILDALQPNFRNDTFLSILRDINAHNCERHLVGIDFEFLLKYFNKIPNSVKQNLINESEDSRKYFEQLLLEPFKTARIEVAKLYIEHCNHRNIFNFFLSTRGLNLLVISIKNGYFEFINTIMKEIAITDQEISQIKEKIFELKAFDVCASFIFARNLGLAENFMNWFSDSIPIGRILRYKCNIPYINEGYIVRNTLFSSFTLLNNEAIEYANDVLFWCMGSERNVKFVERDILLHIHEDDPYDQPKIKCYKQVRIFVLNGQWGFLHKLIIWIRYTSVKRRALGRKLLNDNWLFENMLKIPYALKFFKSFVRWFEVTLSIANEVDGIKDFKSKVLDQEVLFLNLIKSGNFDDFRNMVAWCEPSARRLKRFKNLIYLKMGDVPNSVDSIALNNFLQWLDPSFATLLLGYCIDNAQEDTIDLNSYYIRILTSYII